MFHFSTRKIKRRFQRPIQEINPEEIFLDASNLPDFNVSQFEGRIEKPIAFRAVMILALFFSLVGVVYAGRLLQLQVVQGSAYALQSEQNRLEQKVIFPERGIIVDRNGVELATNSQSEGDEFAHRVYTELSGFSHLLGYVSYPQKDSSGNYFQKAYVGKDGVEKSYESVISGVPGLALVETDAHGEVQSEGVVEAAIPGSTLTLSIDARVQEALYTYIKELADQVGFHGGAGVIMDVKTGELLAITSYPEFSSTILSDGTPKETIASYVSDPAKPFLNRATSGLYTPGSIIKPYVALAALQEGTISPEKKILSTGSLSIPNRYDPSHPTIFRDWKAHGWVDMRDAIAVSSNVYFFEVGGGFQDQPGLGIERLNTYFALFGFGKPTGIAFSDEASGVVPGIAWKEKTFPDEPWRVGDTYNTSIGQYSFQVTALQAARGVASIANGGSLLIPHLTTGREGEVQTLPIDPQNFQVIREGMREGVLRGTGQGLNIPGIEVATKSGTAELDAGKKFVNSWITGFFPYGNPRYSFAVVMEQGPRTNTIGGVFVMRQLLEYMLKNTPEYLE